MSLAVYVFWAIFVCWKAGTEANAVSIATDTPHDTNETGILTVKKLGNDLLDNSTADVPYTPTNLSAFVVTNTSILVQWDVPELPHGFVENYVVQWKSSFSDGSGSTGGRTHYNITGLMPYSKYTVKVRLYNGDATGPWSEELVVQTQVGIPSHPTRLNVTESTEWSISLSWDNPVPDRGPILSFEVQWRNEDGMRPSVYSELVSGDRTACIITNLTAYTTYLVSVRAFTSAGAGPWSSVEETTGIKGVPGRITQIIFDRVTTTTITFLFLGPHDEIGFPTTQYVMTWMEVNDVLYNRITWLKGKQYVVHGLIPGATYNFSAAARNQLGEGPWLSTIYTMPEKTVPEPPRIRIEQEAVSDYPDRFEVRWGAPEDHGSPIIEYEIKCSKVRRGVKGWNVTEAGLCLVRIPPQLSSYEITGLESDSYYMIEIRAKSEAGYGKWASVVIKTAKMGGCSDQYCFNGGLCQVDKGGNPVCYCKAQFTGERCQFGENLMILSREIILISVASVGLIVISLIAVCLLCYCVRSQKTSKT